MDITVKYSKAASPVFAGISLSSLFFSLPVMQALITFGQLGNAAAAKRINVIIIAILLLCSLITDIHFYRSNPFKSAYPISYFSSCLIWAAVSFYYTVNCNFSLIYGNRADEAYSVFRTALFQICAVNAFSLLFRIVFEFYIYMKSAKQ